MTDRAKLLADTKQLLVSVLTTKKDGILIQGLEREYKSLAQSEIPFRKLGHHSLEDFLRSSCKDAVTLDAIDARRIVVRAKINENVAHIAKLVKEQRTDNSRSRRAPVENRRGNGKNRFTTPPAKFTGSRILPYDLQSKIIQLVKKKDEITLQDFDSAFFGEYRFRITPKDHGFNSPQDMLSSMTDTIVVKQNEKAVFVVYPKYSLNASKISTEDASSAVIPPEVREVMQETIQPYREGINVPAFLGFVKKRIPRFKYQNYGCLSMVEFCAAMPDIFHIVHVEDHSDYWLYPKSVTESPGKKLEQIEEMSSEPPELEDKDSSEDCGPGTHILVKNLPQSVTQEDLGYLFSDVGSVIEVSPEKGNAIKIIMKRKVDAEKAIKRFDGKKLDSAFLDCTILNEDGESFSPEILLLQPNQRPIIQQSLSADAKNFNYFDVFVGEVFSPHKFYIQRKELSPTLQTLMEEMDCFYRGGDGISRNYFIREDNCVPGMPCAALYDNLWHRALVTDLDFIEDEFRVSYIDYGSIAVLPKTHLRLLDNRFSYLPMQAFECRLAGIKPPNGCTEWPVESSKLLLEIVSKSSTEGLVAKIEYIDENIDLLVLKLYDTATNDLPEGIMVNTAMVALRAADRDPEPYRSVNPHEKSRFKRRLKPNKKKTIPRPAGVNYIRTLIKEKAIEDGDMEREEPKAKPKEETQEKQKKKEVKAQPKVQPVVEDPELVSRSSYESQIDGESVTSGTTGTTKTNESKTYFIDNKSPKNATIETLKLKSIKAELHVINMGGSLYVTSQEISELFPKWKGQDLLLKMLKLKNQASNDIFVRKDHCIDLFEQCIIDGVRGIELGDGYVNELNLHPLKSLKEYIQIFTGSISRTLEKELSDACQKKKETK